MADLFHSRVQSLGFRNDPALVHPSSEFFRLSARSPAGCQMAPSLLQTMAPTLESAGTFRGPCPPRRNALASATAGCVDGADPWILSHQRSECPRHLYPERISFRLSRLCPLAAALLRRHQHLADFLELSGSRLCFLGGGGLDPRGSGWRAPARSKPEPRGHKKHSLSAKTFAKLALGPLHQRRTPGVG